MMATKLDCFWKATSNFWACNKSNLNPKFFNFKILTQFEPISTSDLSHWNPMNGQNDRFKVPSNFFELLNSIFLLPMIKKVIKSILLIHFEWTLVVCQTNLKRLILSQCHNSIQNVPISTWTGSKTDKSPMKVRQIIKLFPLFLKIYLISSLALPNLGTSDVLKRLFSRNTIFY